MHASLREVQSLVGVLSFASTCIHQGRAFFSRILNFLRGMPHKGKLKYWRMLVRMYYGGNILPHLIMEFWSSPDSWFSTDACLSGGDGYFNGAYFHFNFSENLILKGKHINQFELLGLWKAVELWAAKMRWKNTLIYCDNKTTVDCLHSSKSN